MSPLVGAVKAGSRNRRGTSHLLLSYAQPTEPKG